MRIAIFSTCPKGVYSGGRYHALIAGYCLARRGHEVYFVTDNAPIFDDDLRPISPDNPVNIIETKDFEVVSRLRFDHVIIAPQSSRYRRLYLNAIRLAEYNQAALSFFCFEAANWFNEVSPKKRAFSDWSEWHLPASRGALVLCSAEESMRYAKNYFTDLHPETDFSVWQPAINQIACDAAQPEVRDGSILIFARPMDPHKGSGVVEQLLVPELRGHPLVVVIGNPRGAEPYCRRILELAEASGNTVDFRFGLSDVEKFAELKRASALVFPSFFEGYGYPPIEALATDTHCIAYDLPVIRENCGDLVHYVTPGDVDALREELIRVLATGPADTARDSEVLFRTNIDVRAEHLETVLENYRKERDRRRVVSPPTLPKLRCEVTVPQRINLGERIVHSMMVTAPRRISAAAFSGDVQASCHVFPSISVKGQILHHLLFETPSVGGAAPAWTGGTLYLNFAGDVGIAIELSTDIDDRGKCGKFDAKNVGVTSRYEGGGRINLFAWALPEKNYDAALWISRGETDTICVPCDTGLVTAAYHKKSGIVEKVDCGLNVGFLSSADLGASNHLLLLRNGKIVYSTDIPDSVISAADRRIPVELGTAHDDGAEELSLFRSQSVVSADRAHIRAWTNAVDYPLTLEVRQISPGQDSLANSRLITRLGSNMNRPDVANQYGLRRDDIGFCATLPSSIGRGVYALILKANDRQISRIPVLKLDSDQEQAVRLNTKLLSLSLTIDMHGGSLLVVGRPCKRAISKFTFDATKGSLNIGGWILASPQFSMTLIESGTHREIVKTSDLKNRTDVADKHGKKYLKSGIDLNIEVTSVNPAGYVLSIQNGDASPEVHRLPAVQLTNVTEFKATDCRYDLQWPSIWVRGSFVCPGTRLTSVEIWQQNKFLCAGAVNIKQMRHGDPLAGWRIEGVLDAPLDPAQPVEVRATTDCGAVATTRFTPNAIPLPSVARPLDVAMARLGPSGAFQDQILPPGLDAGRTVLLVVHNLDAVDRPEKLNALIGLRAALAEQGLDLLVFHHCRNPIPGDLPEINFFDPYFDLLRQVQGDALAQDVRAIMPQSRLSSVAGALYGFYASLNFSPRSWKDCVEQAEDEAQRLAFVLRQVKPCYVLLWHQWNSLMEIGRSLCDSLGIPRAYLHEGMLPKTMTFDSLGMMAEAESAGARLSPAGASVADEDRIWLDRADDIIARIRDEGLDRKPLSSIRVGDAGRKLADKLEARLVFYAGINDWHSGNLPETGNPIHSPHYRDTIDGLNALLEIAEDNGWLIMFKPHPNLYPASLPSHPRLFIVREGNTIDLIDVADVVVTILSSISYISLARGKPTVLLGRNTLSDTGAVLEVDDRANLAVIMRRALTGEDFGAQIEAFRNHVGAMLRDHLYIYDPEDTLATRSHAMLAHKLRAMLDDKDGGAAVTYAVAPLPMADDTALPAEEFTTDDVITSAEETEVEPVIDSSAPLPDGAGAATPDAALAVRRRRRSSARRQEVAQ